ncbi:hypothetical protein ACFMPD_13485 [Sedimentitalea sp. HM32M-2]|uniref:hypothetical protein n=1 Tax=Sedimentitalea sp. HM32M-2 TaxID=3351566 RepID=UPI003629E52B
MIRWLSLFLLTLSACNAPSPYFSGAPVTRIAVDGSVFDVRVRGDLAEAMRVNPQYAPRFGPIRARAGFAMARASGCEVLQVRGDQSVATGVLSCGDRPPNRPMPAQTGSFSCLQVSQSVGDIPGGPYTDFDCDPY